MEAEVSGQFVEDLLTSFLSAAVGLDLRERIKQFEKLPTSCRRTIESPPNTLVWVAWISAPGVVVATGSYDHERSRQIGMHALFIEWWIPPNTRHASWWRADPSRPGEWTAGPGQP